MVSRKTRLSREEFRLLALSYPEAHQSSHMGRPDLRVHNKIFATLPEDGLTVNLKTTPLALDMLLRDDPHTFRDVWGGRWVGVELASVEPGDLRELLLDAYCLAAPRSLAKQARAAAPAPPSRRSRS
jgi:hypothetical protein